ncbi:MAG TPA: MaoC family dehydratase [Bryobacteraceae bacterium]|jgi:acyl dehydratase|nr:MaoC family dehydratase [Bryobacteraceae bacterium]
MRIIETVEELRSLIGQEVAVGEWFSVEQSRIDAFAEATGDHQWIHQDVERARTESPFARTIAHGFLTLSLLSCLSHECFEIRGDFKMRINYGLNRVRFPSPVLAGARIRPRFTLQSLEEFDEGYQAVWAVNIEVEGGRKPALYAEWVVRLYT